MSPIMSPRGTTARIPSSHGTHPQLTPGSLPNAILTECSRCWDWRGWGNAKCPSSGLITQKPALSAFPKGLRVSWARKAQLAAQRVLVTLKAAPGLEPPLPILLLNPLGPSDLALPTPPQPRTELMAVGASTHHRHNLTPRWSSFMALSLRLSRVAQG